MSAQPFRDGRRGFALNLTREPGKMVKLAIEILLEPVRGGDNANCAEVTTEPDRNGN